jgi:prepilin signal peptidase PulO-like enzyme (type II secretory pathway)
MKIDLLAARLFFSVWLGAASVEDAMRGGVNVFLLALGFIAPALFCAAMNLPVPHSVWAVCCFIACEKISRAISRVRKGKKTGVMLGSADVCVIGIIALYVGALWTLCAAVSSVLCALYCLLAKKREAPFIPFLSAGAVIVAALRDTNIMKNNGGLL